MKLPQWNGTGERTLCQAIIVVHIICLTYYLDLLRLLEMLCVRTVRCFAYFRCFSFFGCFAWAASSVFGKRPECSSLFDMD